MINKKECEIVQDLLIGYIDNVLNSESKELVEAHLIKCEHCQAELKNIKKDMEHNDNKDQIELDYLKKIRIKTKIKSLLTAIGIIVLLVFVIFFCKFIKINNIMNNAQKSLQTNNFYKETIQILSNNQTSITKEYYKDGKYKMVWEVYSDNGVETSISEYANIDSDERIYINAVEKKATIEHGDITKILNDSKNIKSVPFVSDRTELSQKIGTTFVYSIDIDTYDYGKEYYVLKNKSEKNHAWEIWIDKETGLPIRQINRGGEKSFFPETNVVKEIRDVIQEYRYEFDKVTDDDVKVPDLSDYTIENKVLNIDEVTNDR